MNLFFAQDLHVKALRKSSYAFMKLWFSSSPQVQQATIDVDPDDAHQFAAVVQHFDTLVKLMTLQPGSRRVCEALPPIARRSPQAATTA